MKTLTFSLFILVLSLFACTNNADPIVSDTLTSKTNTHTPEQLKLIKLLQEKDSLLFQIGFNQIDTSQVSALISNDFEFYHDEHGVTDTKSGFIANINGIRNLSFKTWRVLVPESMEIFPLYKDNSQVLYGAIQNGVHDFYQQENGENGRKTNTARFSHLWIIENDVWKLKRVLSYDHQRPE